MSTSRLDNQEGVLGVDLALQAVVAGISARAGHRDRYPSFPEHPFRQLALSGVLAIPVPDPAGAQGRRTSLTEEWRVLRAVARADGSVGRILDGHFNGVERVSLLAPEPLRSAELEASPRGSYSWESGEPTRYQGRGSQPGS